MPARKQPSTSEDHVTLKQSGNQPDQYSGLCMGEMRCIVAAILAIKRNSGSVG
jgi:hypothetical protein